MKEFTIGLIFNNVIFGIAFLLVLAMSPLLKKYSKRWRYIVFIAIGVSLMIPFTMLSKAAVSQMPEIKKEKVVQGKKQIVMGKDSTWKYVREKQEKQKTERSLEEEQAPERQEVDAKEPGKTESSGKKMKNEKKESGVVQWLKQWYQGTDKDVILKGIFGVWIIVAVVNMMYYLFLYQYHKKRIRRFRTPVSDEELRELFLKEKETLNIDREIGLFQCQRINTPMAVGVVHTSILIPYMEHYQGVRYILMHELVHQKKRDMWVKLFYVIVKCVHWFNPFVHLMVKIAYDDIELLCDDEVVKTLEKKERIKYNESILNVVKEQYRHEEKEKIAFSFGMIQGENDLKVRMLNIMNMNQKPKGVKCAVMLCAVILIIGCGTAFHQSYVSQAKENLQGIQLHSKSVYRAMASIERKKREQFKTWMDSQQSTIQEKYKDSDMMELLFSSMSQTLLRKVDYSEQKEVFFWKTVIYWSDYAFYNEIDYEDDGLVVKKSEDFPDYFEVKEKDIEVLCDSMYGQELSSVLIPESIKVTYDKERKVYYVIQNKEELLTEGNMGGIYDYTWGYNIFTKTWSFPLNVNEEFYYRIKYVEADNPYHCQITGVEKKEYEKSDELSLLEQEETTAKAVDVIRDSDNAKLLPEEKVNMMMENILEKNELNPILKAVIDCGRFGDEFLENEEEEALNFEIADMFIWSSYSNKDIFEMENELYYVDDQFLNRAAGILLGKDMTPETLPKGESVKYDASKGKYCIAIGEPGQITYTAENIEVTENGVLIEGNGEDYISGEIVREYTLWLKYSEDTTYHFTVDKINIYD